MNASVKWNPREPAFYCLSERFGEMDVRRFSRLLDVSRLSRPIGSSLDRLGTGWRWRPWSNERP